MEAGSISLATVPSAKVRSGTSSLHLRSITGVNCPHNPQVLGRSRRRISSTSRKPSVVIIPAFAPLRSSRALVATVVPWIIVETELKSRLVAAIIPLKNPLDWSPLVDGTFSTCTSPNTSSSDRISVKVPPTSTPITIDFLIYFPWRYNLGPCHYL